MSERPDEISGFTRRVVLMSAAAGGALSVLAPWGSTPSAAAAVYVQYKLPFQTHASNKLWGGPSNHTGTDFGYPSPGYNANVGAVAAGKVVNFVNGGESDALGNRVEILHADGAYSAYCHMATANVVSIGQTVKLGETIGHVGSSGTATSATHLHLAMSFTANAAMNGQFAKTFDPLPYIQARSKPDSGEPMAVFIAASTNSTNGLIKKDRHTDPATGLDMSGVYVLNGPGTPLQELSWPEWEIQYALYGAPLYKTGDQLATIAAANAS